MKEERNRIREEDVDRLQKINYRLLIMAVNRVARKFEKEGININWGPHRNDWFLGFPEEVGFRDHFLEIPTIVSTCFSEFHGRDTLSEKSTIPVPERERIIKDLYGEKVQKDLPGTQRALCTASGYSGKDTYRGICKGEVQGHGSCVLLYVCQ